MRVKELFKRYTPREIAADDILMLCANRGEALNLDEEYNRMYMIITNSTIDRNDRVLKFRYGEEVGLIGGYIVYAANTEGARQGYITELSIKQVAGLIIDEDSIEAHKNDFTDSDTLYKLLCLLIMNELISTYKYTK